MSKLRELYEKATGEEWRLLSGDAIANTVIVQDRPGMDDKYIAQTNTAHHSAKECAANAALIVCVHYAPPSPR